MSLRRLFQNSTLSLIAKVSNALVQVVCLPVLLGVFGKENYGLIVIAMSLNTFVAIIQLGLPTGIPKFVAEWIARGENGKLEAAMKTVSSFYILIAIINGLVLLGLAFFGIHFFNVQPAQEEILRSLLIITAVTSCLAIPATALDQMLVGAHELGFVARMEMVKNVFFAVLVGLIYTIPDSMTLVQFYAVRCVLMFLMVPAKLFRWKNFGSLRAFLPGFNFDAVWPLLKYCLAIMVFGVFVTISKKLPPVILAVRFTGDVGSIMSDYQIINYVQFFLMMISSSFMGALIPHISGSVAGGDSKMYRSVIVQGTKIVWTFGALIGFGVIMLSKEVLLVYVGEEYLYLQKWLNLYMIAVLYNLYSPAMASAILASGKLIPLVFATGLGCLVSLVTCWHLAPMLGIGSIAYGTIGYVIVYFGVTHFWYFPRYFGVKPLPQIFKILLPPVFAGIVMCVCGRWVINWIGYSNSWVNISIGAISADINIPRRHKLRGPL